MHLTLNRWRSNNRNRRLLVRGTFLLAALTLALLVPCAQSQGMTERNNQQQNELEARNAQGLTPLIVAASEGQTDTVRSLLARRANIEGTAADGRTALIAAAQNGRLDVVQSLISAGADLNAATRGTGTALEVAERRGDTQIASLLLAAGARSSGKSVGDTVCVLPWGGDGFCGVVKSFSIRSVELQVTKIVGCANGCAARAECSAAKPVGGFSGLQTGNRIAVPSWCLTKTGVQQ